MITENIYIWVDTQEQKEKVKSILISLGNIVESEQDSEGGGIWAIYTDGTCIFYNGSKGSLQPEISYQEFLNKYGVKREFKVGDTVRIVDSERLRTWPKWKEALGTVSTIDSLHYLPLDSAVALLRDNNRFGINYPLESLELVQPVQEEGKYPTLGNLLQEITLEELYKSKPLGNIDYPRDGKVNGVKKVMSSIVEFAKNLTLSVEEKLLREVGLKDECGNFTENARLVVLDLEAVELGFKSYDHLQTKVGEDNESSLEFARLLVKHEAKLLEIAKAKKEVDKK